MNYSDFDYDERLHGLKQQLHETKNTLAKVRRQKAEREAHVVALEAELRILKSMLREAGDIERVKEILDTVVDRS